MKRKRKLVYSVTLHEEVAEWLRGLSSTGKLSPGIARAQELLVQWGITPRTESRFRTMPSEVPAPVELAEIEKKCFNESQAAYDAGEPLPDHMWLMGRGLHQLRWRVLERCEKAFGWRHGPAPPHIALPTDNPFGEPSAPRQRLPDSSKETQQPSRSISPLGSSGSRQPPPSFQETSDVDVESIESNRPEGPAAPAVPASTADSSVSSDPSGSNPADVAEPQF